VVIVVVVVVVVFVGDVFADFCGAHDASATPSTVTGALIYVWCCREEDETHLLVTWGASDSRRKNS